MWTLTLVIALFHVLSKSTFAQTTNTTCRSNPTTSFLFNRNNESPCLVWAKLQSLCVPDTAFVNVPPLVDHTYGYNSPGSSGTACQCNIAAYNLMAGCSWCQVGSGGNWASQWAYAQGCGSFAEDSLGFSQDSVMIPPFAWRDWDTARFDPALAAAAAPSFATTSLSPASTTLSRDFASTPVPSNSVSSSNGTTTSRSRPPPTSTSPTDPAHSDDEGTPLGVMIGAIAGAVGAVVLIAMLIFFFILRRRRKRANKERELHEKEAVKDGGKRTSRRFDPNYHSSTDWKHKHRSFLDMLTPTPKGEESFPKNGTSGKSGVGTKPISELFADPKSFFSPRPAPLPVGAGMSNASKDSIETLRYTTTSERPKGRDRLDSFSSGSESSFGIGPPKVTAYTKAKHTAPPVPPTAPVTASNATESMMSTTTTQYGAPAAQSDLLRAVNDMKEEQEAFKVDSDKDDPLDTPPVKDYDKHSSYPFPRVPDTSVPPTATTITTITPSPAPASPAPDTTKALPKPPGGIKTRISTKIPDPRFSSSAITIPQPPITPAHDFTLPPEEYRRKQSRHYSGPKTMYDEDDKSVVLPSLYEPASGAARFSISQRTDKGKSIAPLPSAAARSSGVWTMPNTPTKRGSGASDAGSTIFSATPSNDSRYPSFIPDAQTVARVKAAFGGATPPLRFPLPPSRSGSRDPEHEWEKAKSKEKLSQEVKKIGRKSPIQERGNENGIRRGAA